MSLKLEIRTLFKINLIPLACLTILVVFVQSTGVVHARGLGGGPGFFENMSQGVPLERTKAAVRTFAESCIVVGVAGAAATLAIGTPFLANGIGAPSVAAVVLGAAGVGCVAGMASAGAQLSLHHLWGDSGELRRELESSDDVINGSRQALKSKAINAARRFLPEEIVSSLVSLTSTSSR